MSTKRIATSTSWQIASQAATAVLSILATKFVAIGLSKEFAGYYNAAFGYLQVFAIMADFGLYAIAVREVSKAKPGEEREEALGALLVLRIITLIVSLGPALVLVWILPMWRGTPFPMGVTIAALVPSLTLLAGMMRTVYQVHYRMEFVLVTEVLQRVITTVGIGLFILWGVRLSDDARVYEWFLWIGGLGAVALLICSYAFSRRFMRVRLCFDRVLVKRFFLLAAPYAVAYLLMAMYRQLDVVFISLFRPDFALQNAYYGFAGRVEDIAFIVPTFLLNSVLPILAVRLEEKADVRGLLGKTLLVLLLAGSTFFLFCFFWAKQLTLLFATSLYLSTPAHPGSDTAFMLMSVPMFLNGLVLFAFYLFLAEHSWKRLMLSFGVGVLLTIALNLLWTPGWGFVGAAGAMIIVHCFLAATLLPQVVRRYGVRVPTGGLLRWIAYTAVVGSILWLTAPLLTSALRTVAGGIVMLGVLAALSYALGFHRLLREGPG